MIATPEKGGTDSPRVCGKVLGEPVSLTGSILSFSSRPNTFIGNGDGLTQLLKTCTLDSNAAITGGEK